MTTSDSNSPAETVSETDEQTATTRRDLSDKRAAVADLFDRDEDPLAGFTARFETTDVDPLAMFAAEVLNEDDLAATTRANYDTTFDDWREHMSREGRHPACPNEDHVRTFVRHEVKTKGNTHETAKKKLRRLNRAYQYWQDDPIFPHPTDYNPIDLARSKLAFPTPERKEPPRIPVAELRERLQDVTHLRDRAIIILQLKLGLRRGEVRNMKLADVSLQHHEVQRHYEDVGTNPMLGDRENAVYIPHDRDGNKSKRPRVLPLDDELRRVLVRYLLVRPDNGEPWVFLSHSGNVKLTKRVINETWKRHFHPEYAETDQHRAVTSHFGRHRFTTYWEVEQELNPELIGYMRGDKPGSRAFEDKGARTHYIHTYYEDIESVYLENIYKLGV